jgi:NUMOD4 motif
VNGTQTAPQIQIWRDVPGFEGFYEVCINGRVRSLDRQVVQFSRWGTVVTTTHRGRVLKPFTTENGRQRVVLHDAAHRRHARYVDGLVAETFGAAI